MEELQKKRADIMKQNLEKQREGEQRLQQKKRKVQEAKEKKKQQDEQILRQQKEEKERKRAEFFANMKKGGTGGAGVVASNSTGNAAAEMSETQGGVKFDLVGGPDCMDDENFAASKEQPQAALGDVMVFDMSNGKNKGKKGAKKRTQWGD